MGNSYSVKELDQSLKQAKIAAERAANKALKATLKYQRASHMSFDEAEEMPYVAGTQGSIVISTKNEDVAQLADALTSMGRSALYELKANFENDMKEALK